MQKMISIQDSSGGHCAGVKWIISAIAGYPVSWPAKGPKFYVLQTKNTDKYATQTFIV